MVLISQGRTRAGPESLETTLVDFDKGKVRRDYVIRVRGEQNATPES